MPIEIFRRFRKNYRLDHDRKQARLLAALVTEPLDASLHYELATNYSEAGDFILAYAEILTASYLGLDQKDSVDLTRNIISMLPDLRSLSHNEYFRYTCLVNELEKQNQGVPGTVLDVGGGCGQLAQFLPGYNYCLAEPQVNGISGLDLPFEDGTFDYVVSCHVFEHIPADDRKPFLRQLLSKSRKALILLNPFDVPEAGVEQFHQLAVEMSGEQWAIEHLECGLPELSLVKQFAEQENLDISIKPNGSISTTFAVFFMEYFARLVGAEGQLAKSLQF